MAHVMLHVLGTSSVRIPLIFKVGAWCQRGSRSIQRMHYRAQYDRMYNRESQSLLRRVCLVLCVCGAYAQAMLRPFCHFQKRKVYALRWVGVVVLVGGE